MALDFNLKINFRVLQVRSSPRAILWHIKLNFVCKRVVYKFTGH